MQTVVTTGMVFVMGEITTGYVDIPKLCKTIEEIGYTRAKYGFDTGSCAVITSIDEQSLILPWELIKPLRQNRSDCDDTLDLGAGDQGMMFGICLQ